MSLPLIEKASYFDSIATSSKGKGVKEREDCSTKGRFFLPPPTEDAQLNVWLDKAIVDGIIGNLLFDPDDDEDISTKERFLSVFKLQECDGDEAMGDNSSQEEEEENSGQERYLANVRSKLQFYSCIKMVSNGLSFRQVSNVMEDMKETL